MASQKLTNRFAEYELFEPRDDEGALEREKQNKLFRDGVQANPHYSYPKLDGQLLSEAEQIFSEKIADTVDEREKDKLKDRLHGVGIAAGSFALQNSSTHSERFEAGRQIVESAESRYGELDQAVFTSVLAEKMAIVDKFVPANLHAELIIDSLKRLLPETEKVEPLNLFNDQLIEKARTGVEDYMDPILDILPEEGSFEPTEVAEIAEKALEVTGLKDKGWTVEIRPVKLMRTDSSNKVIIVPNPPQDKPLTKSAADLRRLIPHEVGVHAYKETFIEDEKEEGIAMLVEVVLSGKIDGAAVSRAKNRYLHAGLAEGLDGIKRNARQVFEITWRLEAVRLARDGVITKDIEEKAKKAVQPHIDNAFRGTDHSLPGVYYSKLKIYLEGLIWAVQYAEEHADDPNWLENLLHPVN